MQEKEVISILQNQLNFSEKNISNIKIYINELLIANKKHNFISKSTENVIWHRHILDSAQLVKFIDFSKSSLSDLGSGAGFPGLVILILNQEKKVNFHMTLVESNKKKCSFLKDLIKCFKIKAEVINDRAENLNEKFDIIIGRAVAPLSRFLLFCRNIKKDETIYILPKGANFQSELLQLKKQWYYEVNIVKNNKEIDKSGGVTIILSNFKKKK